jgi:catechol 2,3-dioxygenase-like lactoylglutathione lyase family enzyme
MRLTYVRLLVSDFPASFRFYREVMGFEVAWGDENDGYADFRAGEGANLALFDRSEMSEAIGTSDLPVSAPGSAQDQVMLIFGVDNLDHVVERL